MFVGMTIQGVESQEDEVKSSVESTKDYYFYTDKFAMELLQEIAEYNNTKRAVLKDIQEFKWKPTGNKQAKVENRREKN